MPDLNPHKLNSVDLTFNDIVNIFRKLKDKILELQSVQLGGVNNLDLDKLGLDKQPLLYIEPTGSAVNNYEKTFDFDLAVLSSVYYQKHVDYQNLDEPSQAAISGAGDMWNVYQKFSMTEHEKHYEVLNMTNRIMMIVIKEFVQNLYAGSWVNETALLDLPVNLTPVNTEYDNMLVGWAGSFTVRVNNRNALCGDDLAIVQS